MTKNVSLIAMHAALSPVNCGLIENPSALKKETDFDRSATGKVMNTCLFILSEFLIITTLQRMNQSIWDKCAGLF